MARPWRIEFAGACYHVINRGNYRRNLFGERGAAAAFERALDEAATRFGWRIHAYVVMRNHFHLAVEIAEPNLSSGMQWLQGTWARRYNGLRKLVGRPFQGRYKALLVEPGEALGRVCHYIHLNPVRAHAVEPAQVGEYPWSSLPKFPRSDRPRWLEPRTVLAESGGLRDHAAGWRSYREYLVFLATDEVSKRALVAERVSRGWWIGSKEFRKAMREEAARRGMELDLERFAGIEPEEFRAEREAVWEEKLGELARRARVDLDRLPPRRSSPEKVLLAAALKRTTSASNAWLAKRLGMGQPASASQFVRRWEQDPRRKRALEGLLSRVKT
jgi:REP element-mobilizing transposase RayT